MTFVDFNRYFCIFILRILYTLSHHFRIIPLSHFILFTFALSCFHTFAFYNFPGCGMPRCKNHAGKSARSHPAVYTHTQTPQTSVARETVEMTDKKHDWFD